MLGTIYIGNQANRAGFLSCRMTRRGPAGFYGFELAAAVTPAGYDRGEGRVSVWSRSGRTRASDFCGHGSSSAAATSAATPRCSTPYAMRSAARSSSTRPRRRSTTGPSRRLGRGGGGGGPRRHVLARVPCPQVSTTPISRPTRRQVQGTSARRVSSSGSAAAGSGMSSRSVSATTTKPGGRWRSATRARGTCRATTRPRSRRSAA